MPVLPDGVGSASVTKRSTQGTSVITSLNGSPAPIWRIWAGCGAHPSRLMVEMGNSRVGMWQFAREATVKCCGVVVAMPQGQSWAPPSSSGLSVNTGTVPVLARSHASGVVFGLGPPSVSYTHLRAHETD